MRHYEKLYHYRRKQRNRLSGRKTDCRYDHLPEIMKKAYAVKSKFPISPEEMAEIYTMPAVEDGYDGFLYNEKGKEVNYKRLKSLASCFTDEFLQSIPFGMNAEESASTGL